jgi:hypothetical protein
MYGVARVAVTVRQRDSLSSQQAAAASRAPRHSFKAGRNGPHRLAATNHPRRWLVVGSDR